jgi:hypothetical protein
VRGRHGSRVHGTSARRRSVASERPHGVEKRHLTPRSHVRPEGNWNTTRSWRFASAALSRRQQDRSLPSNRCPAIRAIETRPGSAK